MPQEYQVIGVPEVLREGMIFVRINYILTAMIRVPIIAVCFILLAISCFVQYAIGSPKVLDFTIYTDGTTHVFYQTDVDSQSPDFTLNLYGTNIDNIVVQDENGTILSSKVNTNTTTVETLGSSTIKVDYDTQDLISKSGKTWTFHVDSPIDYSILLPKNSVIVGMTVFPLNMQVVDGQSLISLPSGSSEINYIVGILGTSQTATLAIQKAQDFINTVNSAGIKTPMASAKLEGARLNFNQGKYSDAESLANSAKNTALQEQQTNNSAKNTTLQEQQTNNSAKNTTLQEQQTNNSISTKSDNVPVFLLIVGSIVIVGITGFVIMKKTRSSKIGTLSEIQKNSYTPMDKETIYKLKPELRQDDKEIVAFISEKGGQVYESELRKKFLMPRTTMWRAVKRLEREDIVEIEKVDQQNLIKLRKAEENLK